MSGRLVGEVLTCAPHDLTHLELLVLVALAETAPDTDRTARHGATVDALADKVRSTPGTVRNVLQRLRERGLVVPLYAKPRKGLAQNYRIPKMNPGTRRATLNGTPKASPPRDAKALPAVTAKRHLRVTQ